MTIKHLVISGGGPSGVLAYGVASQLARKGFWKLADIKSIYGCSIGAYVGFILSLNYDLEWIDDFVIKRPWEKLVISCTTKLTDIYEKKCLLNERALTDAIIPFLRGKDLAETITLKELYDYNQIDLHMYATDINGSMLKKIDLSYKSHPELQVVKALRMSMAIPVLFQPVFEGDGCYIDGGLINNYPLNDCIQQQKCDTDEILGFKNIWKNAKYDINEKSSLLDFLLVFMKKTQAFIDTEPEQVEIKYNVHCLIEDLAGFDHWGEALKSSEMRRKIIENGYAHADLFLAYVANMKLNEVK